MFIWFKTLHRDLPQYDEGLCSFSLLYSAYSPLTKLVEPCQCPSSHFLNFDQILCNVPQNTEEAKTETCEQQLIPLGKP
jgi:hypothetical protein